MGYRLDQGQGEACAGGPHGSARAARYGYGCMLRPGPCGTLRCLGVSNQRGGCSHLGRRLQRCDHRHGCRCGE
eukprot:247794-Chlamydomonas_euryale.AAC.1